jgi:lipopolysaccharide/colanic/teichoic acid biosynthesis glycosyltransferase
MIFKFRTMECAESGSDDNETGISRNRITNIGRVLRRLKLDELPQVINVLMRDMSLVGPRPKVPQQQLAPFLCRPGITGPATLAFAREEDFISAIPGDELTEYYRRSILPLKQKLDSDYMAIASPLSDLRILLKTISGCWGKLVPDSNQ